VCPDATDGVDDPRVNPLVAAAAPSLRDLPCERVLVCAAELDSLLPRDRAYYEAIKATRGWSGSSPRARTTSSSSSSPSAVRPSRSWIDWPRSLLGKLNEIRHVDGCGYESTTTLTETNGTKEDAAYC